MHGSVTHRCDPEWSPCAVGLGDVHPLQGLGLVTPPTKRVDRACFLLWRAPGLPIEAGGAFARVLRHSSYGQHLAAVRVGQQALSGFHLVPPACLCRLHDTRLEPTHDVVGLGPVNGLPVQCVVGGRTNTSPYTSSEGCRHLLSHLSRLLRFSRDERPDGSRRAFAQGDVAMDSTLIRSITARPSLLPSSFTRPPIGVPYGSRSLLGGGRAYHVSHPYHPNGVGPACSPVALCLR